MLLTVRRNLTENSFPFLRCGQGTRECRDTDQLVKPFNELFKDFFYPFGKVMNSSATFQIDSNLPFSLTLQLLLFTQCPGEGHKCG